MTVSAYEQNLLDNVEKYGWQCTMVGAGNAGEPGFAYTIGFWEALAAPEIIVFGLDFEVMHHMLWEMCRSLKAGSQLADGARWTGLIEGYDCISRLVHPSNIRAEYFNSALWYRDYRVGDRAIQAYQLVWPGAEQGLFPWESGCSPETIAWQPPLYLPATA